MCETLDECIALNSSINHVILGYVAISKTNSYIVARLNREIFISKLAKIQCEVSDSQNPFQEALHAPMDFLINLISTQKSLQQIDLDIPGLDNLICVHIMTIKSTLINNTTLQKLTICGDLFEFKRNQCTNDMELTTPLITNLPLKLIGSAAPIINVCDQLLSSPPQAKRSHKYGRERGYSSHCGPHGHERSPTAQK